MYKKRFFVSVVITILSCKVIAESGCEDYIYDSSQLPRYMSIDNKQKSKFLYDWLYYGNPEAESIEKELLLLDEFRESLSEGDYLYYKATILYSSDNPKKSIAFYKEADKKGNSSAGLALYEHYIYTSENADAYINLKSSAEKGDATAQFILGNYLMKGVTGYLNENKALGLKYLIASSMAGDVQALLRLMDNEIFSLMDRDNQVFWNMMYNIYEKEEGIFSKKLFDKIDNWSGFCEKYLSYCPSASVSKEMLNYEKYKALRRIVLSCKATK